MKRLVMMYIILQFSIIIVFSVEYEAYEMHNIIQNKIGESIEWKYIKKDDAYIFPKILRNYNENDSDLISISIYFNTGLYELRHDFNNIIENKLLIELKNIFHNYDISISTYYPFNITFLNNINYDLDEKQNIINEIEGSTHSIIVENIFRNSIYGYINDSYFINISEVKNKENKFNYNNFYIFLNIISKYFGKGNIINI
jgi:hypothetical protein